MTDNFWWPCYVWCYYYTLVINVTISFIGKNQYITIKVILLKVLSSLTQWTKSSRCKFVINTSYMVGWVTTRWVGLLIKIQNNLLKNHYIYIARLNTINLFTPDIANIRIVSFIFTFILHISLFVVVYRVH